MARQLNIDWRTSRYRLGQDDAFRVYIEVTTAVDITDRIFAYRMQPKNPTTGTARGYFSHVCSPVDLEDYPEDEPIANRVPAWFRLKFVDVLVRSETEADAFITDVRSDIQRLLATLDRTDTLVAAGSDDFQTGVA